MDNVKTKVVVGGKDYLIKSNPISHLRKYMRVRPKGYSYVTSYRKRQWDGYKYFITPKGSFATGFLPMVAKFSEAMGFNVEVEDNRSDMPRLNLELTNEIGCIDGKTWMAEGKYAYQLEQVKAIGNYVSFANRDFYFPRGILDCATNAGKNSVAALIHNNLPKGTKILFVVSSREIYKQAVDFFSQSVGYPVGEVCAGKFKVRDFTVAMVKTLHNRADKSLNVKKWLKEMEVLIVDESDESGAKQYSKALSLVGAGMRVFVSGTPLASTNVHNMIQIGSSGKVLSKISNTELIKKKVSQKPNINILLNENIGAPLLSYSEEMHAMIHTSLNRVEIIEGILRKHKSEQVLITFTIKEHGYFMYDIIKDNFENVEIIHGVSKNRKEALQRFKEGETKILLSSQILQRGVNIPNIRVLIMAHGGKSEKTVKQYVGRALRHDGKNDSVEIYDIYDNGLYVGKHSRDRIRIYKREEFDVIEHYKVHRGKPTN